MSQQIDFEDIKWGTFTRLFKDFKKKNPNVPVKDLDDFAELVLANPEQFSNKARMKAQFYKNIIMKGGTLTPEQAERRQMLIDLYTKYFQVKDKTDAHSREMAQSLKADLTDLGATEKEVEDFHKLIRSQKPLRDFLRGINWEDEGAGRKRGGKVPSDKPNLPVSERRLAVLDFLRNRVGEPPRADGTGGRGIIGHLVAMGGIFNATQQAILQGINDLEAGGQPVTPQVRQWADNSIQGLDIARDRVEEMLENITSQNWDADALAEPYQEGMEEGNTLEEMEMYLDRADTDIDEITDWFNGRFTQNHGAGRKRGGAVPPSDIPHHTPTPEMRFHERRERGLQRVRETLHLIDGLRNHLENRMFDIDVIPFDDVERHQAEQLRNNLIETNNIFDAMGNDLQAVENVNANVNLDELDEMLHNIHQNLGIATHQLRIADNFLDPFLEETEMVGQGRKRDTYKSGQERTGKSNDSIRKFFGMGRGDEDSSSSDEEEEGAGRLGDLLSPSAWAEYGKAVIKGRTGLPPKVRKILEEYGDAQIIKMEACRTPVPSLLTGALNAVSFGAFEERFGKLPYDKLYHLDLRVTVATEGAPVVILLEKNEVINASISPSKKKDTECVNIPIKRGLTLNKLMEGAEKVQGEKFLKYSAYNNNCQDFVMSLLRGSGIGNQVAFNFIKQETKSLFKDLPALRRFANTVTDIGAVANTIITGAGKKKMPKWAKDTLLATKILKVVAPMAMGGKKSKALSGLEKFGQSIAKGTEKVNPMMWAIQNEKTNKAMRQSGEATRDYALPAVVTAGMPMYYGTAGLASTATTGNPLIGVALANELWQQEGAPYQPQSKSESLNKLSEIIGKEGSRVALAKAKGAGRHLYDADVVADYLTNLRPRNRFGAPMTFEDINWHQTR